MEKNTLDVVIPTYKPGKEFEHLLERLEKQEYPIRKIIVMNTEEQFWNPEWEGTCSLLEVHHLKKHEFDHGGTRRKAAELSESEFLMFMTQDALPANRMLTKNLVAALEQEEGIGAAFARQLPRKDCSYVERYTRKFNYPEAPYVRWKKDLPRFGVKTFFCSNVCAVYKRRAYESVGGFVEHTIFNEDMICAGALIQKGYGIAYAADACVIHSHNYTGGQQFHRNFDLGVSQAEHPEIFANVSSEGEGMRLVEETLSHLVQKGKWLIIPGFIFQCGCKYAGYLAGKHYKILPRRILLMCTMNRDYWKKNEN